jgi:hypothetical protein
MASANFVITIESREMIDEVERLRKENLYLTVQRDMLLLFVAVLAVILLGIAL